MGSLGDRSPEPVRTSASVALFAGFAKWDASRPRRRLHRSVSVLPIRAAASAQIPDLILAPARNRSRRCSGDPPRACRRRHICWPPSVEASCNYVAIDSTLMGTTLLSLDRGLQTSSMFAVVEVAFSVDGGLRRCFS